MTIGRVWRDAMQSERMSHSKAMATTNNAAMCPPDAIQVLQLFMNDSLYKENIANNECRLSWVRIESIVSKFHMRT
ncbi:hypothetical protein [Nitrosomonas sp.]|uniref:hypothetical protein n=1 Tax=Nitrosomonas sp. TaxID=42353 RepID=UPI0025F59103|nr:hypothetical protein [Nitrosomonas sp.]